MSEESCDLMVEMEIAEAYAEYEQIMGKGNKPPIAEEPTDAKLSAIKHLFGKGLN